MLVGVGLGGWSGTARLGHLFFFLSSDWVETGFASCDITLHRTARASCSIDFCCTSFLLGVLAVASLVMSCMHSCEDIGGRVAFTKARVTVLPLALLVEDA